MTIRTGFIGLGNQGKPIAAHLAPAGFETTVYDIAKEPVAELVAGGAKAAETPRATIDRCWSSTAVNTPFTENCGAPITVL